MLRARASMCVSEWAYKTESIRRRVRSHPWFLEADTIYCYMDFRREAGTRGIMEDAWKLGKKVAVPRTGKEDITFWYIDSPDETAPGTFGVLEPDPVRRADGSDGLVLLPGAAFDLRGNRIGYGKGYYDRYLHRHPRLQTMAIAFDFQVLERIPAGSFDVQAQMIATDRRLIEAGKRREER